MAVPTEQITKLLEVLSRSGIEFIVTGGAAGVLHGAPVTTLDLDIVHRRTPENIGKLLDMLHQLGAYFHPDFAQRRLPPRESDLAGHGHLNMQPSMGRLDVLCEVSEARGYDELLPHTEEFPHGDMRLRVLDLPTLIAVKAAAGRPKDRVTVPILIATLEERKRRTGEVG